MNKEEVFIKELEDYFWAGEKMTEFSKKKVVSLLKDYTQSILEPKTITVFREKKVYVYVNQDEIKEPDKKITVPQIFKIVSKQTGVSEKDIKSKSRQAQYIVARNLSIYMIKQNFPSISVVTLGDMFGGRDHSTICHSLAKTKEMLEIKDQEYLNHLCNIQEKISEINNVGNLIEQANELVG